MSNPFYNYSGQFIPGTLGRAEAVAAEYNLVQAGFSALVVEGTDSGAANAYVITTLGAPTGSYTDGAQLKFKAANSNSGASVINVNGIGSASIFRFGGTVLQAGDIVAGIWYTMIYNSTYGGYAITAPVAAVGFAGTVTAAAPTNKVKLVAAGGVSTSVLPADATWAIDQSIIPTWTGAHIFSAGVTMNSGLSVAGSVLTASAGLTVTGAGVQVGSPAGGDKGVGTINVATGLYIANVAVPTTANGANPSAKVGSTAVNGSATTWMRSDGAPAIDLTFSPVWTNTHTWTASPVFIGDTNMIAFENTATTLYCQIGNVKGWTAAGSTTDTAIGAKNVMNFYASASSTATLTLTVGAQIGQPTGADKGAGTLNVATGYYINGTAFNLGYFFKIKATDTTRTTVTVPANDPDLTVAIPGAGTYVVTIQGYWSAASTAPGFGANLNFSGTFGNSSVIYTLGYGGTVPVSATTSLISSTVTPVVASIAGVQASTIRIDATLVATGAGTLAFSWAQGSSSAVSAVLKIGAYMAVTRVA